MILHMDLNNEDAERLCEKAGSVGLNAEELLESFIGDLIYGERTNGSDERMYADMWFDRCQSNFPCESFLSFLVNYGLLEDALEAWDELNHSKYLGNFDDGDTERIDSLQEELNGLFEEYQEAVCYPQDQELEKAMSKAVSWQKSKDQDILGLRCTDKHDMKGTLIYENDILESHLGGQVNALELIVRYGLYKAYCPADESYVDNVGFYIEAEGLPPLPLGPTEEYALVVGRESI